jgi:hypothetical protein
MIPKRYRGKYNRMLYSYVWNKDGDVRPQVLKQGFFPDTSSPLDLIRLLEHLFPYGVSTPSIDELNSSILEWLGENNKGAWQLWSKNHTYVFLFENESDAIYFKMRWT